MIKHSGSAPASRILNFIQSLTHRNSGDLSMVRSAAQANVELFCTVVDDGDTVNITIEPIRPEHYGHYE